MQALLAPLKELAEFGDMRESIRKNTGPLSVTGCVDSQKLHMIYGLSEGRKVKVIVTYSDIRARQICEEYRFYDRNVMLYPAKDLIFFQADVHGNQLTQERVHVLKRLYENKPVTVVTTFAALMAPQAVWQEEDVLEFEKNGTLDLEELSAKLVTLGYEKVYQVEGPGQFSVRGGILDIFDLTWENPCRVELWGEEIDSIRSFDLLSQRSIEQLESISVYPAAEFVLDPERMKKGLKRIKQEAQKQEKLFRDAHKPEEAHRIQTQVRELEEQLTECGSGANLDSYVRYFFEDLTSFPELVKRSASCCFFLEEPARIQEHADGVELEFKESMAQRRSEERR